MPTLFARFRSFFSPVPESTKPQPRSMVADLAEYHRHRREMDALYLKVGLPVTLTSPLPLYPTHNPLAPSQVPAMNAIMTAANAISIL